MTILLLRQGINISEIKGWFAIENNRCIGFCSVETHMWGLQRGAFPRWKARRGNGFLWNEIRSERNRGQRGMTHFQDDYRNQCKSWLKVKVVGEVNLWIRERGTEDPKKLNWGAKIYFTLEMYILPWKYLFHLGNVYFALKILISPWKYIFKLFNLGSLCY